MAANYPPPWNQVGVGHCHVKYYVPESSGRQGFSMNLSMQGGQDGSMSTGRNHQSPNNTSQFTNAAGQDSYESLTLADLLASAPFGRPSILRGLLEQGKGQTLISTSITIHYHFPKLSASSMPFLIERGKGGLWTNFKSPHWDVSV